MAPLTFPSRLRLTHDRQFEAVHAARMRKASGVLSVASLPNGLQHWRLGLAVSRKCGGAVVRNRIKRCVRESFRLLQHDLPRLSDGTGLDIVISVRPHVVREQGAYQELLQGLSRTLVEAWEERRSRRPKETQ